MHKQVKSCNQGVVGKRSDQRFTIEARWGSNGGLVTENGMTSGQPRL